MHIWLQRSFLLGDSLAADWLCSVPWGCNIWKGGVALQDPMGHTVCRSQSAALPMPDSCFPGYMAARRLECPGEEARSGHTPGRVHADHCTAGRDTLVGALLPANSPANTMTAKPGLLLQMEKGPRAPTAAVHDPPAPVISPNITRAQ